MSYWLRELAGWALLLLGVYSFFLAYSLALSHHIVELWPIAIFGIFIFRGGIHFLKVAIAARSVKQVQERLYPLGDRPRK
jgi:hypothetical protein